MTEIPVTELAVGDVVVVHDTFHGSGNWTVLKLRIVEDDENPFHPDPYVEALLGRDGYEIRRTWGHWLTTDTVTIVEAV
jgi:hypothetical protein